MREVKCRAWDETHKEWVDSGFCLRFDVNGDCQILNAFAQPFTDRTLIPVFFTGRFDKAGKEIYEGDIVSTLSANPHYRGPVKFGVRTISPDADGESRMVGFYVDAEAVGASEYITDHMCRGECVIVGNIYENPELIND